MEDQCRQLQVQVGDGAAQIGESDQIYDNVGGPLLFPGNNPYPPSTLSRDVCVAYVRHGSVDKLGKVGPSGCHLDTQASP